MRRLALMVSLACFLGSVVLGCSEKKVELPSKNYEAPKEQPTAVGGGSGGDRITAPK